MDSPNLYGYIYGGGDASGRGNANVGDVTMVLEGCNIPVYVQLGAVVAASIYGGGRAAADSAARAEAIEVAISGGEGAGNLYMMGDSRVWRGM